MIIFNKFILNLLFKEELSKSLKLLTLVIIVSIIETLGVVSVIPFLSVIGDPELISSNDSLIVVFSWLNNFGITSHDEFIIVLGLGSFFVIISASILRIYSTYSMNYYVENLRHKISLTLLRKYLDQSYEFFLHRYVSDLTKNTLSEVDQIVTSVLRPTVNIISYSFVIVFIVLSLIFFNPLLVVITFGLIGFLYFVIYGFTKENLKDLGEKRFQANEKRFSIVHEVFDNLKYIKQRQRENVFSSYYDMSSKIFAKAQSLHLTISQIPKYIIEAIVFGGVIALVLFLIITSGGIQNNMVLGKIIPTVGLYTFAAYKIQPAIQNIFASLSSIHYGDIALKKISYDLNLKSPDYKSNVYNPKNEIKFIDISYRYPTSKKMILENFNFTLKIGEVVGVVGKSGSGKTTFIDILIGLLNPTNGLILIDGIKVSKKSDRSSFFGYVPQDVFLTKHSIAENIAMESGKANINLTKVEESAKSANILDFISKLPDGFDTKIGDRGVRLSGGQRQRIGIARALYNDPTIIIFDESTSSLDRKTEFEVLEEIYKLGKNKTILIISHDLNTLKQCNRVINIDKC